MSVCVLRTRLDGSFASVVNKSTILRADGGSNSALHGTSLWEDIIQGHMKSLCEQLEKSGVQTVFEHLAKSGVQTVFKRLTRAFKRKPLV